MKMTIGDNIKRLRKDKGVTQEQLSEVLGVTFAAVSKWERGETLPDITLLQPLAFYFEVSVDALLGYDEEKVRRRIDEVLKEYTRRYRAGDPTARDYITAAYREYPNDYRIMNAYMWNIAGNFADNDPAQLLAHEEELSRVCDKLLSGCTDLWLRGGAIAMQGKLLHAKGRTADALELYRANMSNWYETAQQKSEQLFAKDTPEFLRIVTDNAFELASFAADKLHKSIYFDASIPYATRVARIEACADGLTELRRATGEFFFATMEHSLRGRLWNDLIARGGAMEDILRVGEKLFSVADEIEAMATFYATDKTTARFNARKTHLAWAANFAGNPRLEELRREEAFAALLKKYQA